VRDAKEQERIRRLTEEKEI
jgi:hypothetical protein